MHTLQNKGRHGDLPLQATGRRVTEPPALFIDHTYTSHSWLNGSLGGAASMEPRSRAQSAGRR